MERQPSYSVVPWVQLDRVNFNSWDSWTEPAHGMSDTMLVLPSMHKGLARGWDAVSSSGGEWYSAVRLGGAAVSSEFHITHFIIVSSLFVLLK